MSWQQSEWLAVFELLGALILEPRTALLMLLLIAAACVDVKRGRIPNWLVFAGAGFAIVYNGVGFTLFDNSFSLPFLRGNGWLVALNGLGIGLVAFLPLYLLRAMGAGDVKLMAMVGAFLGPWNALYAALATLIAGGLLAIGFLLWTGTVRRTLQNISLILRGTLLTAPAGFVNLHASRGTSTGNLPYGVAIAAGTIGYLLLKQLGFVG
jgi:prepilin peptidase CpaA